MSTTNPDPVYLARYKENADQARHHEVLRERSTTMVAQTTGVLLGLLGFKEGNFTTNPIVSLAGIFIILLGIWGIFSSVMSESRARRHRARIDKFLEKLDTSFKAGAKTKQTVWVWVLFHSGIIALGVAILALKY